MNGAQGRPTTMIGASIFGWSAKARAAAIIRKGIQGLPLGWFRIFHTA
jgi:hypothetical protein